MPKTSLSPQHAFFLGIMALMVAVLCVTVRVIQENIEARIVMAVIWAAIAVWWLVQAHLSRRRDSASITGDSGPTHQ